MLGIAKDEERRVASPDRDPNRWYRKSISNLYSLIAHGMDRAEFQQYIANSSQVVPVHLPAAAIPGSASRRLKAF